MTQNETAERVETEEDFDAAVATLVMAFTIDPVARWMCHGGIVNSLERGHDDAR